MPHEWRARTLFVWENLHRSWMAPRAIWVSQTQPNYTSRDLFNGQHLAVSYYRLPYDGECWKKLLLSNNFRLLTWPMSFWFRSVGCVFVFTVEINRDTFWREAVFSTSLLPCGDCAAARWQLIHRVITWIQL